MAIQTSCAPIKNLKQPTISVNDNGYIYRANDGANIFIYDYKPNKTYNTTIFIISGITGINHNTASDIIKQLSNNENRIVVIHPRGTGYSDGKRGDISDFSIFINDYIEIIKKDIDYTSKEHKILLFGHSLSTAVLLAVANKTENTAGAIVVNPPYILKKAKGMSPSFFDYIKYGYYYIFAKHKPIVNMAGNPDKIKDEEDKKESESRINDPLLVKYFSLYMMKESGKLINSMIDYSKKAKYPLLLIYGSKDNIVDKKGCDLIFKNWNHPKKQYFVIQNGAHGKSSVLLAKDIINKWIKEE